jgi:hypothetical protein
MTTPNTTNPTPTPPGTIAMASKGMLSIQALIEGVVATVGLLPSALIGALGEVNFDFMDRHRRSVIKYSTMGRGGQKFIAAGLHRYGRKKENPEKLADVVGESFAAAQTGRLAGRTFKLLEEGGPVAAREWMAIPVGAIKLTGGARRAALKRFERQLKAGELIQIQGGLLVNKTQEDRVGGAASRVVGVLRRRRDAGRPRIAFYQQFERLIPLQMAKYEKAAELALTAAGRARLTANVERANVGRAAYSAAFRQYLEANPGKHAEAKKVALAAKRAARAAMGGGA